MRAFIVLLCATMVVAVRLGAQDSSQVAPAVPTAPTMDQPVEAAPAPTQAQMATPPSFDGEMAAPSSDGVQAIRPGMTEDQVIASWGKPVAARDAGNFTYLYFENDCLRRCGTFDLVILQGGQTVDAIARASYHRYDGVSSSPNDRLPEYTPPPVEADTPAATPSN